MALSKHFRTVNFLLNSFKEGGSGENLRFRREQSATRSEHKSDCFKSVSIRRDIVSWFTLVSTVGSYPLDSTDSHLFPAPSWVMKCGFASDRLVAQVLLFCARTTIYFERSWNSSICLSTSDIQGNAWEPPNILLCATLALHLHVMPPYDLAFLISLACQRVRVSCSCKVRSEERRYINDRIFGKRTAVSAFKKDRPTSRSSLSESGIISWMPRAACLKKGSHVTMCDFLQYSWTQSQCSPITTCIFFCDIFFRSLTRRWLQKNYSGGNVAIGGMLLVLPFHRAGNFLFLPIVFRRYESL